MNSAPQLPHLQPMPALPAYVAASIEHNEAAEQQGAPAAEQHQDATTTTATTTNDTSKPKKDKKTCCVANCDNKVHLQRVPAYPPPLPLNTEVSKTRQITHAKKVFKRQEFLERLGRPRDTKFKDLRFCPNHKMERQSFTLQVHIKKGVEQEEIVTVPVDLVVPVNVNKGSEKNKLRKKKCCVVGCQNHVALRRVPPLPKQVPLGSSKARQITRAKKVFKRNEYIKRLLGHQDNAKVNADLRFCHNHKMETRNWTFLVPIMDGNGVQVETVQAMAQFEVPLQVAPYHDAGADDRKQPAVDRDDRKQPAHAVDEPAPAPEPVHISVSVIQPSAAAMQPSASISMEPSQPTESEAAAFAPPVPDVGKKQEPTEQTSDHLEASSTSDGGQPMQTIML